MKQVYDIVLKRSVLKDIRRIPRIVVRELQDCIAALAIDPFPHGVEPIAGYEHHFRIRVGNYRIIYEVAKTVRIITIIRIGHRKEGYRSM